MNRAPHGVTPDRIMDIGMGFWASKTLLSAVELGVFTLLAKGPADLETARTALGLHPRAARDFLDALVALKLLKREDGIYSNAAETDLFLDRAKPSYLGGILEMANDRLYGFWGSLTEALQSGKNQNEAKHGGDFFAIAYADPKQLRTFLAAMSAVSASSAKAIAEKFAWRDYQSFVDVGAAQGKVSATLAEAYPHLRGIGFDLPQVRPIFEEFIAQEKLTERVRFQAGDFFQQPIPNADVVVMGHILHDWDLETKRTLVRKAFDALPSGGALIVYDSIIDDDRRANAFGLLMSLTMLVETPGGFDYTGSECRAWMLDAGFREADVVPLVGPDSMVVAKK
ncbi:MAG TPA: methyltransferase [Stellaceae bacterium]|nr:methyltransferase [Stellaceae bacterium]